MPSHRTRQSWKRFLAKRGMILLNHRDPKRRRVMDLILRIKSEVLFGLEYIEGWQLFSAVQSVAKIPGDIAEVGVFRGGSAKLICEARGEKALHLFDTFSGIPSVEAIDEPHFQAGTYVGGLGAVQGYLRDYRNVHFHPGIFPETAGPVRESRFALVHLDVDTHRSTADCLEFFHPRMSPGGIIISHDYRWVPGVKKAFDDYYRDRPEPVLELGGSQCMVVRVSD